MESRKSKTYRKSGAKQSVDSSFRKSVSPSSKARYTSVNPSFLSSSERSSGSVDPEIRKFVNPLKPLLSEDEKSKAQVLDLSYDFSCRIIRLYKYLNEGKLEKADRDIIDALGRQLVRSATSINANLNEAQHPQSDADFLSKASISLKEARESENWLNLLRDNGYLSDQQAGSLLNDCIRINKILITITSKVRKRIHGTKESGNDGNSSVDS